MSPAATANGAGQATLRPPDASWRIKAAAWFFFCLHCSLTQGNARVVVVNALDAQGTAKGIVSGDEISACHSEA